ncbi:HESP054 [Hemileuca sp. nucleopolyhedrovirus]|uniref:HESP054 n=1 Tax=Hemileuca sp. nucleopolyhedrovirus TaxID=1367203 RepID=S5MK22_9ABAC|nr:HESP054 [Hemileuca sp. nucleopolyhedrovirus]AGR56806.1 HESP054 [Hemileuca sp. nucleopolyhedrovirus]
MGCFFQAVSRLNSLFADDIDTHDNNGHDYYYCCEKPHQFDAIKSLLEHTDHFKHDTVLESECPELNVETAVYDYDHQQIFELMWMAKYAKCHFLYEKWSILYYKNYEHNTCYRCSDLMHRPSMKRFDTDNLRCVLCQTYYNYSFNDDDKLYDIVFNSKNYCTLCRRPLYDIICTEDIEYERYFEINDEDSCCNFI